MASNGTFDDHYQVLGDSLPSAPILAPTPNPETLSLGPPPPPPSPMYMIVKMLVSRVLSLMLYPGAPGAPYFSESNVTEFLY